MKHLPPARRRSKFEESTEKQLVEAGIEYEYEPKEGRIPYIIPAKKHLYLPDFIITAKSGKKIIIECKGIWDFQDRYKHYLIKKENPELDIRFVFYNAKNKIRKGSTTTYADICEGKGRGYFKNVTWKYATKTIPKEWLEE